jgi:hypothetical protein
MEPAAVLTNALPLEQDSHAFSESLHSRACELLLLLQTVLQVAGLRAVITAQRTECTTSFDDGSHTDENGISSATLTLCAVAVRNDVLLQLVSLLSPAVQYLFDYVIHKYGTHFSPTAVQAQQQPRKAGHSRHPSNLSISSLPSTGSMSAAPSLTDRFYLALHKHTVQQRRMTIQQGDVGGGKGGKRENV